MNDDKSGEDKKELWDEVGSYVYRLTHGPSPQDRELLMVIDDFFHFMVLQIFRNMISGMTPEARTEICNDIRTKWKKRLRMNINQAVKDHVDILAKAGENLGQFIGDGEAVRITANETVARADKAVERIIDSILKSYDG